MTCFNIISHRPSRIFSRNFCLFSTVFKLWFDSFSKVESDWFRLFSRKNWMINLITLFTKDNMSVFWYKICGIYKSDILFFVDAWIWHFESSSDITKKKRAAVNCQTRKYVRRREKFVAHWTSCVYIYANLCENYIVKQIWSVIIGCIKCQLHVNAR